MSAIFFFTLSHLYILTILYGLNIRHSLRQASFATDTSDILGFSCTDQSGSDAIRYKHQYLFWSHPTNLNQSVLLALLETRKIFRWDVIWVFLLDPFFGPQENANDREVGRDLPWMPSQSSCNGICCIKSKFDRLQKKELICIAASKETRSDSTCGTPSWIESSPTTYAATLALIARASFGLRGWCNNLPAHVTALQGLYSWA